MVNSKPFIIGEDKLLTEAQQACVDMLEEALSQAKRGKFESAAVVMCMKSGSAMAFTGGQIAALYMGCGDLQNQLMDKARSG